MALDVNGYNSVFNKFVTFAQENRNVDRGRPVVTDIKLAQELVA